MTQTQPRRAARPTRGGRRAAPRRRRRSLRPLILFLALVLVVGVGAWVYLTAGDGDSGTAGGPPPKATPITKLSAELLPPIAQEGRRPAAADKATPVVDVTGQVVKKGSPVTLQTRRDKAWVDLTSQPLDDKGHASFALPDDAKPSGVFRVVSSVNRDVRSAPMHGKDWNVAFEDQFDGFALDETKWGYRQLGLLAEASGRTKSESSTDAVRVENGALKLSVLQNPARPGYYLNGHISTETKYAFTYGVAAARVKFQKPRGMHGGFWMQSPTFGQVPGDAKASGGEIDAVEYFGDGYPEGGLASFTYFRDKDGQSVKQGDVLPQVQDLLEKGDAWWKRYHVFSVEWTPEAYVFRIDGHETLRQTQDVSGVNEFLVLSLLSSDWELPHMDDANLPSDMKVDWVRVWQQKQPDAAG